MAETDVAIVGGGPVGLTLAVFLAQQGVDVTVLESAEVLGDSPRAIVYLHNLLPDLESAGLLGAMLERAYVDRDGFTMHLPAFDEVINIPLTTLEEDGDPYPFNLNLGQDQYCRIALERLQQLPTARVLLGAAVTSVTDRGDDVAVSYLKGDEEFGISARWLVGADGGHSVVRKSIGASLEGTTWSERFVATNVRFDFAARGFNASNMYVDPEIGCIVARISPDGLWRCTYQEPEALPEDTVAERMPLHFERLLGPADAARVQIVDYRPYRMHQRLSSSLRQGRILLAGDAAHLTNPTGGLGLTSGLYDVFLLQEVLLAVVRGGGDAALDYYAQDRARVFRDVASPNATAFKRLVYDSTDLEALRRATQPQRDAAQDPAMQRMFLAGVDSVRSPSWASVA